MSDMDAFKSSWSEDMPTSPDTPATPGDELNMFGTAVSLFFETDYANIINYLTSR